MEDIASIYLFIFQLLDLKKQAKELTVQSSQWQERARDFESKSWEMKLNLETREQSLVTVKSAYEVLIAERNDIKM